MVPLKNRAALAKIQMNPIALGKVLGKNGTMAYCFTTNGGNGKVFSRGMLPWEQYEDAATGSAAGSLGAYLVRHGKLSAGHTLNILQGEEMGRPSHIEVEVTQSRQKTRPARQRRRRPSFRRNNRSLTLGAGEYAAPDDRDIEARLRLTIYGL